MLRKDPRARLGGARDAQEVKEHPFFRSVDWEMLERRMVAAPIVGERRRIDEKIPEIRDTYAEYLLENTEIAALNKESSSVGVRRGRDG